MANDINLLPSDLRAGKKTQSTARSLTRLAIGIGFLLVLFGALGAGILYWLDSRTQTAILEQQQLIADIKNLESTESRLVLIRDRIQRAQKVLNQRSLYETTKKYEQLIKSLPAGATFGGMLVNSDATRLTLYINDSNGVAEVLNLVENPKIFQKVEIENLTFSSITGFRLTLNIF